MSRADDRGVDIKILKPGAAPECTARLVACRGCPGWAVMKDALLDPSKRWNVIHCPATGLTLAREPEESA